MNRARIALFLILICDLLALRRTPNRDRDGSGDQRPAFILGELPDVTLILFQRPARL